MNHQVKIALLVFVLGLIGILSLYFMELPEGAIPEELYELFTPQQVKLLTLINPTIFLLLATIIGSIAFPHTPIKLPVFSSLVDGKLDTEALKTGAIRGVVFGLIAGTLLVIINMMFESAVAEEQAQLGEQTDLNLFTRFAYGGIMEEILMRFGIMTAIAWFVWKVSENEKAAFLLSLLGSSLAFAVGHLPIVYSTLGDPSIAMIAFVILGNTIGGLFFGWLYWNKGLASAMIAHIFTHVAMVSLSAIL